MNELPNPPLVLEQLTDGVLTLSLGAMPAHPLSLAMINALIAALDRATADQRVRVIVLHGAGHIFCAGHDLKEIARHRREDDDGLAYLRELFARCSHMMQALVTHDCPVIAMTGGITTAGGLQMLASCDFAIASTEATFCLPGVSNGGFCTTPSVAVGRVIGRRRTMEMSLSGEAYDAEWALAAGLVNRVVPPDRLARETHSFALSLTRAHAPALAAGKRMLYQQLEMPLAEAYDAATEVMIGHFMDPVRIRHEKERWT